MGQTMPGPYLLSMGFISNVRPYCGIVCNQVTRAPAILLYIGFYAFAILGIAIARIVCNKQSTETNNKQGIRQ
jgi:hypothetical protein